MSQTSQGNTAQLRNERGVTLIVMVLAMMVFAVLGAVLVSMQSTQFETARAVFRETQALYVGDAGVARGKQLLVDDPTGFKGPTRTSPWVADPDDPTNDDKGYVTETMTVSNMQVTYEISVAEDGIGDVVMTVEASVAGL